MDERSFKILRDVDDKVSHLLKFVDNIHVVDACLIVLATVLDIFNLCYFSNRCLTASRGWYRIILGPANLITWRIRSLMSFL